MPTYVYVCRFCGSEREERHSMSVEPDFICDVCGGAGESMNRKPALNAVKFVGDGWASKE